MRRLKGTRVADVALKARARIRRCSACSEEGFILVYVLAIVVMLSIAGLSILSYTVTATKVSGRFTQVSATLRVTDAALDEAAKDLRANTTIVGAGKDCATPPQTTTYEVPDSTDQIVVSCTNGAAFTNENRVMNLLAVRHPQVGADTVVGMARIRVTDVANNGTPVAGYSIEVCDWLLGTDATIAALKGCPS